MSDAYRCPKCGGYVLGDYCFACQIDIRNYLMENKEVPDVLKDIFGDKNE